MRFFHLSDLHIGKQLHHYNLKEDQEAILAEVVSYAKKLKPDAIVIAGDIYDKTVPSAEAVTVFDHFLTELSGITPVIPILIISGNHDSPKRLEFAGEILRRYHIHIAGSPPERPEDRIEKVELQDAYGKVNFYLLPFLKPGYVKNVFGGEMPESYDAAVRGLLAREKICKEERNVLVSHQFYTGKNGESAPETCDSEVFSVGGIDNVSTEAVEEFDYAALGHLHGPQRAGKEHIRYCGTLLKYSVSEEQHKKGLLMVELGKKGEAPHLEVLPLHPVRDVRRIKGTLESLLNDTGGKVSEDYVSVTLTDETEPYKPKERLSVYYPHILEIRTENARTKKTLESFDEELALSGPFEIFEGFYEEIHGKEMSGSQREIMRQIFEEAKGEEAR